MHKRPEGSVAGSAVATAITALEFIHGDQVAFQVLEDLATIWTCRQQLATCSTPLPAGEPPVETHPHPDAAENEKLRPAIVGLPRLVTQLEQFDQRVRAVENPDAGTWRGFQDLAPPLVNQVGRRDNEGSPYRIAN